MEGFRRKLWNFESITNEGGKQKFKILLPSESLCEYIVCDEEGKGEIVKCGLLYEKRRKLTPEESREVNFFLHSRVHAVFGRHGQGVF